MGMNFLHGAFLAGVAVALVPIIIHLVQRRRVQQVVFGSVQFLRKMSQRVVRRRRFTELLLILLRTLAIALLAIAFARPFFLRPAQRGSQTALLGQEAVLVLVDNSYSMSAANRLELAKEQALEALKDHALSKVGVATFNTDFELRCPVGSNPDVAAEAVRGIKGSHGGTNLAKVLQRAHAALDGQAEQHKRIVLISDFQQSGWDAPDFQPMTGVALNAVNVADKTALPNAFIERVAVPRVVVAGAYPEVISAKIVNLTDQPLKKANVVMKIGQETVQTQPVTLEPGQDVILRFRHIFKDPGDITGSIELDAKDELPADNTAWFSIHVPPKIRVLLVNPDPDAPAVRNDAFFIRIALSPKEEELPSPFEVRERRPAELTPGDFVNMDVVIFTDVDTVAPAVAAALTTFVKGGGGVAFVCGPRMDAEKFNASLAPAAPCKLLRRAREEDSDAGPVVISLIDLQDPVFRAFAGPHQGDFATAQFVQYYLVKDALAASVAARFSDGAPAMLSKALGAGRSVLLPSALDLEWNNLCLKSVFVPFVHELTRVLCAEQSGGARNQPVGERLVCRVPDEVDEIQLRAPDGRTEKVAPSAVEGERIVSVRTDSAGIYELTYKGGAARFAVNLDPREPDLRVKSRKDTDLFAKSVVADHGPDVEMVGNVAVVSAETARERIESQQKLWMVLVAVVLALLATEMIVAWKTGSA